jgi:hypothetical protein
VIGRVSVGEEGEGGRRTVGLEEDE